MSIRINLEQLRKKHPDKPSQRFMGDLLGIAETNYRNLEKGRVKSVTFEAMSKLCEFFECTASDLFEYVQD